MRRFLFSVLMLLLTLASSLTGFLPARAAPDDTSGYIFNGGFEGDFYPVGAGQVAEGWTRVNLSGNPTWQSTQVFADGGWVEKIEGEDSHILSVENLSVGQPFNTVLYTRVNGLTPGKAYSFSGWFILMWGGSAAPNPPSNPTALGAWMGVDTTGGTDPTASRIIWGNQYYQRERPHLRNRQMAFVATGTSATLFVRVQLSEQRAETQVILDAMELFDAPCAVIHTPSGTISTPRIDFSGRVPQMLRDRGNYQMYYKIEKRDPSDGGWDTFVDETTTDNIDLPIAPGETVTLRIEPRSYQPAGDNPPLSWPPTTHMGIPSNAVTVTYAPEALPRIEGAHRVFLPIARNGTIPPPRCE